MQHIEKSAFRPRTYTALAGTSATLTRFAITRYGAAWKAIPDSKNANLSNQTFVASTLRDLDRQLAEFSK